MSTQQISVGSAVLLLELEGDRLLSLGAPRINGTLLRNRATRFLPWFDTFDGEVFSDFRLREIVTRGEVTVVRTIAFSNPDALFRERRDSSGDPCFRNANWDDQPQQANFDICFAPAKASIDGRPFSGFRYWFEYQGPLAIHRIVDRQTWEIGGDLTDVNLCLRNWLTPPRLRIAKDTTYSTVGLDKWASLLPGNLWGRWSLLPGFDLQYGAAGIFVAWFDRVSLIRTVVESNAGEDCIRHLDLHLFAQATQVTTNPKSVLFCPDRLDHTDALNLWTRLQDRELERSQAQYGITPEPPPAITFSHNVWSGVHFDTTYEDVVQVASEFGGDYVFIDVVFEHEQAYAEHKRSLQAPADAAKTIESKVWKQNMCCILDWRINDVWGGEAALKRLCERAAAKGVKILSWMSTHASPNSYLNDGNNPEAKRLGAGAGGVFAGKESGRHPDTGYPASCWTFNLNTPVTAWLGDRLLETCEKTGLAGYLWDSFSNLGWWQLDYSQGTMAPQCDQMAGLYARLSNAGLYLKPEALVSFSSHSACGLHGGNIYADELLGFSYNTTIALWFNESDNHAANFENRILRGQAPIDMLFQCLAHKRVPSMNLHLVPRAEWHAPSAQAIRDALSAYKALRARMIRRTVLKDGLGVRWDGGDRSVLFAFRQHAAAPGTVDALTQQAVSQVEANRAYLLKANSTTGFF